jgi:hypothetical protein
MVTAEASAVIDAPIERVWQHMTDVARYGDWNPFIVRADASGPVQVGCTLALTVRWPSGGGASARERVTRMESPRDGRATFTYDFIGPLALVGAIRATRVQALEADGARTRYTTREELRGWLSWALPIAKVRAGFAAHAEALKRAAER